MSERVHRMTPNSADEAEVRFHAARRRAWLNALGGRLFGYSRELLSLHEVRRRIAPHGQRDLGVRSVPLASIVGSEGRMGDFDRRFLPLDTVAPARWRRIFQLRYEDHPLPAVELFKLGAIFFVRDGHHRVSVARAQGQTEIDARVIELATDVPLTPALDAAELGRKAAQSQFLRWSGLPALRPGTEIPLHASEPEVYQRLMQHIEGHHFFLERDLGRTTTREEAILSWYERLFLPQVAVICRSALRERLPRVTRTSLYLQVMEHRYYLSQWLGYDPGPEAAVQDFVAMRASQRRPGSVLLRLARRLVELLGALAGRGGARGVDGRAVHRLPDGT